MKKVKHHLLRSICAACYLFGTVVLHAQNIEIDYKRSTELADSAFSKWDSKATGGIAIAVMKDGEIVYSHGVGMANLEYEIPISTETIFHAASLSKQFTAYAALLLESEGKLSMEDDVRKYIPEVPDFGHVIRLKHLANHTSGLRDQWRMLFLAGYRSDDVVLQEDVLDLVSKQEALNFEPGSHMSYSNTGFSLLAEVVARVSGMSFSQFTQKYIFDKVGMSNSQFYDDYERIVKNRAYSYHNNEGIHSKKKLSFATVGATNLFTTVLDLAKWANYLNTPTSDNIDLINKMNANAQLNDGSEVESANGQWIGVKYRGLEWIDHTGSDASFRSYFSRFPEHNAGVFILANTTPINASAYALGVANLFLEDYYLDSENEVEKTIVKVENSIELTVEKLRTFTGKYLEDGTSIDRKVILVNDSLTYYRGENNESRLIPVGENVFQMKGESRKVMLTFEKNERGEDVLKLEIAGGSTYKYIKYDDSSNKSINMSFYSNEFENTIDVFTEESKIYLKMNKFPPVELQKVTKTYYMSSDRNFRKVIFGHNSIGEIVELVISNGGAQNVVFKAK